MRAVPLSFLLTLVLAGALSSHAQQPPAGPGGGVGPGQECGGPPSSFVGVPTGPRTGLRAAAPTTLPSCLPPYQTPAYTKPPDNSVVFGSLLEAAGAWWTANRDWVGLAAGNFCRGSEKELVLLTDPPIRFSILGGPTPHALLEAGIPGMSSGRWRAAGLEARWLDIR
jgi:hypothetical protein